MGKINIKIIGVDKVTSTLKVAKIMIGAYGSPLCRARFLFWRLLHWRDYERNAYFNGPMWNWFGLSYGSYLVVPRTILCGMPRSHQEKMAKLLEQIYEEYDSYEQDYAVQLRTDRGRFKNDPLANYKYPPALPRRKKQNAKGA